MIDRYSWSCNPIRNISHKLANLFTYNNTIDIDFMYYDDMPSFDKGMNLEVLARKRKIWNCSSAKDVRTWCIGRYIWYEGSKKNA